MVRKHQNLLIQTHAETRTHLRITETKKESKNIIWEWTISVEAQNSWYVRKGKESVFS